MEFITSTNISPALYPGWTKAALSTSQADPFCCTMNWQLSFHNVFHPEGRFVLEESARSVVALAEYAASPQEIYLAPLELNWLFGCPLLGRYAVELMAEVATSLEKTYNLSFAGILVSGIRPGGNLSRRLLRTFSKNFKIFLHSEGVQAVASLAGGLDGFLARRSAGHRRNLKREAKLAQEKSVYFERLMPLSDQEAAAVFARMLAVELTSWKGIGHCGMEGPQISRFYELMLQRMSASKEARVIFAKHGNKDIGFIFGGMAGNIYRGQQFSYNNEWKNCSIGNLLQLEKIRWLCEEGVKRYDMGAITGPRMGYKIHWTEKQNPIQAWLLRK